MVLDITIAPVTDIVDDAADAYTVHVESHRILSVATGSADVAAKWLNDVLKSSAGDKNSAIVVAVKAEENGLRYTSKGLSDDPYNLITINVGSHCLLYDLPYKYYPWDDGVPRSLTDFFGNPRVFAVGVGMAEVSRKLKSHHGLEIRNAVDVNDLAVKGSAKDVRDRLDLGRYDLGKLAMAVLGRRMEVDFPESIEWFGGGPYNWDYTLTEEKVKFTTVETFLCYLIASKFVDAIDGVAGLKKKPTKKKSTKHGKSGGGADGSKGFVLYDGRYGLPLCSY